jgi:hypothetical protein
VNWKEISLDLEIGLIRKWEKAHSAAAANSKTKQQTNERGKQTVLVLVDSPLPFHVSNNIVNANLCNKRKSSLELISSFPIPRVGSFFNVTKNSAGNEGLGSRSSKAPQE